MLVSAQLAGFEILAPGDDVGARDGAQISAESCQTGEREEFRDIDSCKRAGFWRW